MIPVLCYRSLKRRSIRKPRRNRLSKLVTTFTAHREAGQIYLRLNGTAYSLGMLDAFDLAQLLTDLTAGVRRPEPPVRGWTVNFGMPE